MYAANPVPELYRKHGVSDASFYKWRAKYGGMDLSNMARQRELKEENQLVQCTGMKLNILRQREGGHAAGALVIIQSILAP